MVWQPPNVTEACSSSTFTSPTSLSACSTFGMMYFNLLVQLYSGSTFQEKQDMCDEETKYETKDGLSYDFVVVGAGAAGCVVANRLSANPKWKVLLVEAGPEQPDVTRVPGFYNVLPGSSIDWKYSAEPNGKSCLASPGGRCDFPRGKTMGGTTAINGMTYARGNRADYDGWALMGNKGWSYEDVLPFFKKSELNLNKYAVDSEYHGVRGEQYVSWLPHIDQPAAMLTEAFNKRKIPYLDFNGATPVGCMPPQTTTLDGLRVSAYDAFIDPIRYKRPNFKTETNSEVTKIHINSQNNAYGVDYVKGGKRYTAYAKKEVIICAGALNSPKLLMLSGIGPKEHLESLNIPVVRDLAVGENLHDHVTFIGMLVGLSNQTNTLVSAEEILCEVKEFSKMKSKKGPLAGVGPIMSAAFIKTDPGLQGPDIEFQASSVPSMKEFLKDPLTAQKTTILTSYYEALISRIFLLAPKSKGRLLLNENDPHGPPVMHADYLSDERDIATLLKGIRFFLSLEDTEAFRSRGAYMVREKLPHCTQHEWGTDAYYICLIKHYTASANHQVGTCKMGPKWDKKAVVDSELRVYGIKGLRVIDASIMPVIVHGNTMAPTTMIGERGVDYVVKYWQNRTKNYCF